MTIATESVNETEIENENQAEDHLNEKENQNASENENGKEIVVMKEETLRIDQDIKRVWRTIIVEWILIQHCDPQRSLVLLKRTTACN